MKQLRDFDLVDKLLAKQLISEGLPEPYCNLTAHDPIWYSKDSPVQPSSLDLHVGEIYIPTEEAKPLEYYCLSAGQTVIITSSEVLNIPSNISAFGYPPDALSQIGILMVNLGHIDPGWQGKIKFVLINVGKQDYPIKKNDLVGTFLFFELDENVVKNYKDRRPGSIFPSPPSVAKPIKALSKDFLDVDKRANSIVKRTVNRFAVINGLIGTLFVAIITVIGYLFNYNSSGKINDIKIEIQSIKKDYEYHKLKNEVDSLKKITTKLDAIKVDKK